MLSASCDKKLLILVRNVQEVQNILDYISEYIKLRIYIFFNTLIDRPQEIVDIMIIELVNPVFKMLYCVNLQNHLDQLHNVVLIVPYRLSKAFIRVIHIDIHGCFKRFMKRFKQSEKNVLADMFYNATVHSRTGTRVDFGTFFFQWVKNFQVWKRVIGHLEIVVDVLEAFIIPNAEHLFLNDGFFFDDVFFERKIHWIHEFFSNIISFLYFWLITLLQNIIFIT